MCHRLLKGRSVCGHPATVPEAQVNELVVGALADQLLTADRLTTLLREAQRHRKAIAGDAVHRRAKDADTRIDRLYTALADVQVP